MLEGTRMLDRGLKETVKMRFLEKLIVGKERK